MQQVGDFPPYYWVPPNYTVPDNTRHFGWPNGGYGLDARLSELIDAMNRLAAALEKHK